MTLENVMEKLALMGINVDKCFEDNMEQFDHMCKNEYLSMTTRMRSFLGHGYSSDKDIPQALEHVVEDWTIARIIDIVRIRDPSLMTKEMKDLAKKLEAVPQTEIARYRRLA